MYSLFAGASLRIAKNLIEVSGLGENLDVFHQYSFAHIDRGEVLKLLLAMDACNLQQTMRDDFIAKEISPEDSQDILEDYLMENLRRRTEIRAKDGAERMDQCLEILEMSSKFQEFWSREDTKDPGPRYYCVKYLLQKLGSAENTPIHDSLFQFVYEQRNRFIRYFKTLLEPFQGDADGELDDAKDGPTEILPDDIKIRPPEILEPSAPVETSKSQPKNLLEEEEAARTTLNAVQETVPLKSEGNSLLWNNLEELSGLKPPPIEPSMLEETTPSQFSIPGTVLEDFNGGEIRPETKKTTLEDMAPNPNEATKPFSKVIEDIFLREGPLPDLDTKLDSKPQSSNLL